MHCFRCGVEVVEGAAFCGACGSPVSVPSPPEALAPGPAPTAVMLKRPSLVTVLAVLQFIGAAISLLMALGTLAAVAGGDAPSGVATFAGLVLAGSGVLGVVCGLGLLRLQPYGRTLLLVFAWIGLLAIPLGTVVAILVLVYLYKPGIKLLFSGRAPADFTAEEQAEVAAISQGSAAVVAVVVALVVGGVVVLGLVAAIAIPGLVRARMAGSEASAIMSLRQISSAQAAFAGTCGNGAYAPTLASLATPPSGRQDAFITPDLAADPSTKNGYRITLSGGAAVPDGPVACNGVSGIATYFVEAAPVTPGSTGLRYFAVNQEGTIYSSGSPIAVAQTGAPANAEPVR